MTASELRIPFHLTDPSAIPQVSGGVGYPYVMGCKFRAKSFRYHAHMVVSINHEHNLDSDIVHTGWGWNLLNYDKDTSTPSRATYPLFLQDSLRNLLKRNRSSHAKCPRKGI